MHFLAKRKGDQVPPVFLILTVNCEVCVEKKTERSNFATGT